MAAQESSTMMANTIVRLPTVKATVGLGSSTIYLRMSRGEFPKAVPLGGGAVGWLKSEIEAWLEQKIAERG